MNKIILLSLIFLLCFVPFVCADIYVLYDKTSKEIVNISERENLIVNDDNLKIKVLPKTLAFYALGGV